MTDYLLDTNHASPLVTLDHPLREYVLGRFDQADTFAICTPIVTELLFGLRGLPRATRNLVEWRRLRLKFRFYATDETDAEVAAELQVSLRNKGQQLKTVDALIAAIALRYDLILLTTDKDFGAVPNLRCENWLKG